MYCLLVKDATTQSEFKQRLRELHSESIGGVADLAMSCNIKFYDDDDWRTFTDDLKPICKESHPNGIVISCETGMDPPNDFVNVPLDIYETCEKEEGKIQKKQRRNKSDLIYFRCR